MHFSKILAPVVALLATSASASPIEKRAVTADQMVTTINKITQQSKSLATIAQNLNPMSGVPLLGPGAGSGTTDYQVRICPSYLLTYEFADYFAATHRWLQGYHHHWNHSRYQHGWYSALH